MGFDKLVETAISAMGQVTAVLIVSFVVYGFYRLLSREKKQYSSFFDFVGLVRTQGQFDKTYWMILFVVILHSMISTYLQFHFSNTFKYFLMSDTSPYGKILKNGFNLISITSGAAYCFIQAGTSEELLFRGLIGRRLFKKFGTTVGNLIQAFVFWLMHLVIFRLVMGDWFSWIQVYAFVVSFGLGLIAGFVNFRKGGQSIMPSLLLHGCTNFLTFLTLGFIIK